MKNKALNGLLMVMVLTAVQPIWAAEDTSTVRTSADEQAVSELNQMNPLLNTQLGVSSFDYSGSGDTTSKAKLSGGVTVELGEGMRKMETGILVAQTGTEATINGVKSELNTTQIMLPMMAKLRLMSMASQSWYTKVGLMPAFEVHSNHNRETNNINVLGSLGVGGRMLFNKSSDFIVEASYNRGLIDSLRAIGDQKAEGILVLAGMSFRL